MSERPKELASKASVAQVTVGSNPTATALDTKGPSGSDGPFVVCPPPREAQQRAWAEGPLVLQDPAHKVRVRLTAVTGVAGSTGRRSAVRGGQVVAVQWKKLGLFVVVVFVLYVIITDPAKAADYVQVGFEGVSSAAQSIGDFMTWVANGGKD